jgi:hypothetical protein
VDNARKKELARIYKESKRPQGIFSVRCDVANGIWLGATRNLDAQQNQIWFGLRTGNHSNKEMQAAFKAHGETSFRYEIVEVVEDDNPLLIPALLKEREKYWMKELKAAPVIG